MFTIIQKKLVINIVKPWTSLKNGMATEIQTVICETINNKGIITLNKKEKLNSTDWHMIKTIKDHLIKWKDSQSMVLIKGVGRAFCAGGDVVSLTKKGPNYPEIGKDFFRMEYGMNGLIGTYPVPYVAIIDGITMGGGAGLSIHGKVRIATEKTLFAMPETAIGFFPDVGMSYVLARLPNNLGKFLGMTGYKLKGADVTKIGIATHFINSKNVKKIYDGLINLKNPKTEMDSFLQDNTENIDKHELSLDPHLKTINSCFLENNVEDIMKKLQSDGSPFAKDTADTLTKMSPTSLKVSLRMIDTASKNNLKDTLIIENRLSGNLCNAKVTKDFYEGVRAMLIDKDKKPKWNPSSLEQVTQEMVDNLFKPLKPDEELKM